MNLQSVSNYFKQAPRVIRTLHQAVGTMLVSSVPLIAILNLPAEKTAQVSAVVVAGLAVIAKVYNVVFPAEPPIDVRLGDTARAAVKR